MYDWMFSQTLNFDPVVPTGGGQVIASNLPLYAVGDQNGNAIPAGTGFAALGTFSIPDVDISATRSYTLDRLADSFIQFGASMVLGIGPVQGAFSGSIGAGFAADDPLVGKNIFLVVGNGSDIGSSDSLFVVKSDELFTFEAFQAGILVNSALSSGQILLGGHGTVVSSVPRGSRAGIVAAAVNVPEPFAGMLVACIVVLFPLRRVARR
jgi:hypothetical protein